MNKSEKEQFEKCLNVFKSLYSLKNTNEFEFTGLESNSELAFEYPNEWSFFNDGVGLELIIYLLLCKKHETNHPFFKKEYYDIFSITQRLNKRRFNYAENEDLNRKLNYLRKEYHPIDGNSSDLRKINHLEKIISENELKYKMDSERLDQHRVKSKIFDSNKFPLFKKFFNDVENTTVNIMESQWTYLMKSLVIKKKKIGVNKFIIDLLNSIPKFIINKYFDLFIEKIIIEEISNSHDFETGVFIKELTSKFKFKSICSLNPELLFPHKEINKFGFVSGFAGDLFFNSTYFRLLSNDLNKSIQLIDIKEKQKGEFDLLIGKFSYTRGKNTFYKFISTFDLLKKNGRAILCFDNLDTPKMEFFFKRNSSSLCLQTIISLKGSTVVIVKKTSNPIKKIIVFDGVKFENNKTDLNNLIKDFKSHNKFLYKTISLDHFTKNNNSLFIKTYFKPHFEGQDLSKFFSEIKFNRLTKICSGKYVSISDLTVTPPFRLNFADLKSFNFVRVKKNSKNITFQKRTYRDISNIHEINQSCLLLAKNGNLLKPTFFEYNGASIFVSKSILALKLKKDYSQEYLLYELNSPDFKEQLKYVNRGITIPYFVNSDILNLKLLYPENKQYRDNKIKAYKKIIAKELKVDELLESINDDRFNSLKALNHEMGTQLANIRSGINIILNKMVDISDEEFNEKVGIKNFNLKKTISIIDKDFTKIIEFRKKFKEGLEFNSEKFPLKTHNLREIYDFTIKILANNVNDLFELEFFEDNFEQLDLGLVNKENLGLEINLKALEIFIEEFIKNTHKHAKFLKTNFDTNKFKLQYNVKDDETLELSIANNGKSFNSKFDKNKFITFGQTSNSKLGDGIGGYIINNISILFKITDWKLFSNEEDPVKFVFNLKLKHVKE